MTIVLRGRRPVSQAAVRAYGVVVVSPGFDQNLGFLEGVEDLPVQELVAQPRIETLNVAVLPG